MTMNFKIVLPVIAFMMLTSCWGSTEPHASAIRTLQADGLPVAIPTLDLEEMSVVHRLSLMIFHLEAGASVEAPMAAYRERTGRSF